MNVYVGKSHHPRSVKLCPECGESKLMLNKSTYCSRSCAQKGARHGQWAGDNGAYTTLHQRVYRSRGKASDHGCESCGRTDDDVRYEWANQTGNYADVMDYKSMCVSLAINDSIVLGDPDARRTQLWRRHDASTSR